MKLEPNEDGLLDLALDESGGIIQETTFRTLILSSLMLNRRAGEDDVLPYGMRSHAGGIADDRQGWTGDVLDPRGRVIGSRLWLLAQELATAETRRRAREYLDECLEWAVDDGYVSHIVMSDNWPSQTRLDLKVDIHMTNGEVLTLRVNYETGGVYVL